VNPDSIEEVEVHHRRRRSRVRSRAGRVRTDHPEAGEQRVRRSRELPLPLRASWTETRPWPCRARSRRVHTISALLPGVRPDPQGQALVRLSHEFIQQENPVNIVNSTAVTTIDRSVNADQLTWQVSRAQDRVPVPVRPAEDPELRRELLHAASSSMTIESGGPQYTMSWTAPFSPKLLVDSLVSYQIGHEKFYPSQSGVPNDCVESFDLPFLKEAQCRNIVINQTSGSFPTTWKDDRSASRSRARRRSMVGSSGG